MAAPGGLAGQLEALRGRLLEDMGVVRGRLAPSYPAGLGAFGIYLRGYHGALAEWIGAAARRHVVPTAWQDEALARDGVSMKLKDAHSMEEKL